MKTNTLLKRIFPLVVIIALQLLPKMSYSQDEVFVDPNQPEIDSLLNAVKPDSPDSVKAKNYSRISYIACNYDTCQKYAYLSLEYCNEADTLLRAYNYGYIAFASYMKDESRKALQYRLKAVELFDKLSEKWKAAATYIHIGNCYLDLNIKDSIFYYYNKAILYFTEIQDTNLLISSYNNLGQIYCNMSLYASAEQNFQKALNYSLAINDTTQIALTYCLLGRAIGFQSDTLTIYAVENLKKSVRLYEAKKNVTHHDVEHKNDAYMGLAEAYIKIANRTGKKAYADSCNMFIKKIGNYYLTVGSNANYVHCRYCYVDYLIFYKRYNDALSVLLGLEKYQDNDRAISAYEDYYNYLYTVYSNLGDYKNALKYHEKYMEYKMAYVNDSTLNSIKDAEVERTHMLDSVNHHYETLRIEAEHQNEMLRSRVKTRVLLSIALLVILIVVIMFFFYKTTKENEENKLRNKALETERSLLRTQMNPHFIFNALNSVQSYILGNNTQEAVGFLSKFAKLMRMILNNSMVQSVTLSNELQSLSLYLDLERARFNNKFNYRIDIDDNVEEELLNVPPMLVQPFIENAIIHGLMHKTGNDGLITIKISENDSSSIVCQITDNGVGRKAAAELEKNNERKHKSVGMQLTRDRLRDLNKEANAQISCTITDLEDEAGNALGTQVTIIIPVVEEDENA